MTEKEEAQELTLIRVVREAERRRKKSLKRPFWSLLRLRAH